MTLPSLSAHRADALPPPRNADFGADFKRFEKTAGRSRKSLAASFAASLAALALTAPAANAQTQRSWVGGNGTDLEWDVAANWQGGNIPVSPTYFAHFGAGASASINVADGSTTSRITLDGNTNINFVLNGAFITDGLLRIGNTAAGTSEMSFSGTGSFTGGSFNIGTASISPGGNSLSFLGSTSIHFTGANATSYVGRYGSNNWLDIANGNHNTLSTLYIGYEGGNGNNRAIIRGAGTRLTISDSGSNRGLRVGSASVGTDYASGMQNNYLTISGGGEVVVTSAGSNSNLISIGNQAAAHSNYLTIDGAGSKLVLGKGTATVGSGTTVSIGNAAGTNLGGNYVEIKDGGALVSEAGHSGTVAIYGHDTTGTHAGSNRLIVGDGGKADLGGLVLVDGGVLSVSGLAEFSAAEVAVNNGGRFEVAGSGFTTSGSTTISGGSTMAVTSESGAGLELNSEIVLADHSSLELTLFDESTVTGINLTLDGTLDIGNDVILKLIFADDFTAQAGNRWTLFTGETGRIDGSFSVTSLPTLASGLSWDISALNTAGGWEVSVIPEPGVLSLTGLAAATLILIRRRRRVSNR